MENLTLVFDTGSKYTKAGFAGEAFPRVVVPTAVGRFRHPGTLDGFPEIFCGKEAIRNRGLLKMTWPVRDGQVVDWDEMEKLWHHLYYKELYVPPEESRLLHVINPLMSRKDKEIMVEILFEVFGIRGLYITKAPVAVVHASGKTTGCVVDIGDSCCHVTPVFEGFPLVHAISRLPLQGQVLTSCLQKAMAEVGYNFTTSAEMDILDEIKAKYCYVASDYDNELIVSSCSGDNKIKHVLPDGQTILLGQESFKCPEVLFQPSLFGFDCPNLVDVIISTINRCDLDYRKEMYDSIILAGGSSMFTGLEKRLVQELMFRVLGIPEVEIKVDAMTTRQLAPWNGGSIIASLLTYQNFWVTTQNYADQGFDSINGFF